MSRIFTRTNYKTNNKTKNMKIIPKTVDEKVSRHLEDVLKDEKLLH